MAVRAYKHALLHFLPIRGDRLAAGNAEGEGLCLRVYVMEVEVDDAAVISADGAAASSLLHEDALELLESASDGLSDTALASPTPRVERELGDSVPWAHSHLDRTLACR